MQLYAFDQKLDQGVSDEIIEDIALSHARAIKDLEISTDLCRAIHLRDYQSLLHYNPWDRVKDPMDFFHTSQCLAYFSKRIDLDLSIDREAVAYDKFLETERNCRYTNECFRQWSRGYMQFPPFVERILSDASRLIASCLGDLPSIAELKFRFGPGASTDIKKRDACAREKLSNRLTCSEDLLPVLKSVLEEVPAWVGLSDDLEQVTVPVTIVPGRLSFVPKSAKTDRGIVVEPLLNSFVQLGIGDYIATRLKRVGVDLSDQSLNQRLAREGSLTGALATLDLSSASDTISTELVYHLLPIDWSTFLDRCRTRSIEYGDAVHHLEKFSSMGNGFTFALESLIFWALARAVSGPDAVVAVYGDDIIVPVESFQRLITVLRCVGFTPNVEKSFALGPFRESCGKDYYSGIDVRPVFVKDRLTIADLYRLHNFYFRSLDFAMASHLRRLVQSLSSSPVLLGPDGYGDGHLLCNSEELADTMFPYKRNCGFAGWTFETYTLKPRKTLKIFSGDFVYPLYSIYERYGSSSPYQFALDLPLSFLRGVDRGSRRYKAHLRRLLNVGESAPVTYRRGRLESTLPGAKGVKRVRIYTLAV